MNAQAHALNPISALQSKAVMFFAALVIALGISVAFGVQQAHAETYNVDSKGSWFSTYEVVQKPSTTSYYGFRNGHYGILSQKATYGTFYVKVDKGPWTRVSSRTFRIPVFGPGKHTITLDRRDVCATHKGPRICCNRHYIERVRKV